MLFVFSLIRLDELDRMPWRIHECALARWRISLDAFGSSSKRVKWRFSKRVKRFYRLCFCVPIYMKVCVPTLHPLHRGLKNEWFTVHFIEGWIGWRVYEQSNYEYAYTRVNNNKVYEIPPSKRHPRISILNPSTNQRLSEKIAKTLKKVVANIWQICCKAVILHPLSREKRRWVEILNKGTETWASTSKKNFFENFFWKVLVVQKKALPLHPLSERKP